MAFPPVPFQEWFLRQTSTGNAALNAYVARVKADGGVVEAIGCVPQAVWDWVAPVAPSFVGLLDLYPNAAAAYSLRKLRAAYSGAAVRVRESGGNTEADIGFTSSGELDTAALLAHCGANDGLVTTWYDQSLSNDATQATAANQPKIVSAGSLVTENGKVAISPIDRSAFLQMSALALAANTSVFSVLKNNSLNSTTALIEGDNANEFLFIGSPTSTSTIIDSDYTSVSRFKNGSSFSPSTRQDVYNGVVNQSLITHFFDGSVSTSVNLGYPSSAFIGMYLIQELIVFNSDQSTNRTGIETNINDFYSIYP